MNAQEIRSYLNFSKDTLTTPIRLYDKHFFIENRKNQPSLPDIIKYENLVPSLFCLL